MQQYIKTLSNEMIDLGNSTITVSALKEIVSEQCPNNNIKEIHITQSMLGDEGAEYIADLIKHNQNLEVVHLISAHNFMSDVDLRITEKGMAALLDG